MEFYLSAQIIWVSSEAVIHTFILHCVSNTQIVPVVFKEEWMNEWLVSCHHQLQVQANFILQIFSHDFQI